ncbi:hypothetical protein [Winogradskyella sp.]|uniref:hypothetical protein n=1 Tax=Winogradskyella sp. TaxID=1883156 RepID=UPI003BAA9C7E
MKALYKFRLLALCFFIGMLLSFSQSQDWSAESYLVTINGKDVEINSTLTLQGASLVWHQNGYNTAHSLTFMVTGSSGSWDAQNQLGTLTYNLTLDSDSATMTVTGTAEGISIALVIDNSNTQIDSYSFEVETFTQP